MPRKNIVLVDPSPFGDSHSLSWGFHSMEQALPRSSLIQLSASLKKAGHTVTLLDLGRLDGWNDCALALKNIHPDWVCITAHTLERAAALKCSRLAKKTVPHCRTVLGGIHFSIFPEHGLQDQSVDYILRGEGDISLPKLIHSSESFSRVSWGIAPLLDQLPFADRELYEDYAERTRYPVWDLPVPIVDMVTGRGCPWKCRFCCGPGEQNLFTRPSRKRDGRRIPHVRRRSPQHVLEELAQLKDRYDFRGIIFHDDQFLLGEGWNESFCKGMVQAGYPRNGVAWWAACRADQICSRSGAVDLMRRAGLSIVSIGFESFSDRMLTWMNKGTTADVNRRAASIAQDLGLKIYANVMFGLPGPDGRWRLEDDQATFEALLEVRPHWVSPSYFTPVPGSSFHAWMHEKGLVESLPSDAGGARTPDRHPIRGVDYDTLDRMIEELRRRFSHPWQDRMRRFRYRADLAVMRVRQRLRPTPGGGRT